MNKVKRIFSLLLAAVLALSLCSPVFAAGNSVRFSADVLYTLGLVKGTENGFELDKAATRDEAIALTIRLTGQEAQALSGGFSHPFTDVPDWSQPYIGYGYSTGLVKGTGDTTCGAADAVSANDFVTLMLRALGYDDSRGDFFWGTAALYGFSLGLGRGSYDSFTRGDMFEIALAAISAKPKNGGGTMISALVESGAVERAKANAVGLLSSPTYSAREISDKFSSAVFLLKGYLEQEDIAAGKHYNTASGFFITEDGLAVTNYHSIKYDSYVYVTTNDGERYPVTGVLYYDDDIDIAVIRVSRTAESGSVIPAFPCLETASSDTVSNGDTVYALSSPLGMQNSISSGIVGNRAREVEGFALSMIQNTASISQGSSGGALLNEYGQVIGVTSAMFTYGQDMYLAVPMDPVLKADLSVSGWTLPQLAEMEFGLLEKEKIETENAA